jgi:hypothetical protein
MLFKMKMEMRLQGRLFALSQGRRGLDATWEMWGSWQWWAY